VSFAIACQTTRVVAGFRVRGVIEGFYGPPWSWAARRMVVSALGAHGGNAYVYAPKNDPHHRDRWRDSYPPAEMDEFAGLAEHCRACSVEFGFAISPGLDIDYDDAGDRALLLAKLRPFTEHTAWFVLALDDIRPRPGLGAAHASLAQTVVDGLGDARAGVRVTLVPTEYTGSSPSTYLTELSAGLPDGVDVMWTGPTVCSPVITASHATARAASLGGRLPLVWDNYPVNDGMMADRLHLGPLWGREPKLADRCCGYLSNPLVQPKASKLPLASIAAWLRGEDPLDAWAHEAEALGQRIFAEACDGSVPQALVQHAVEWIDDDAGWDRVIAPLREWLQAATDCGAPGIEDEVGEWLEQVHTEARLALDALKLVDLARAGEFVRAIDQAFAVSIVWQSVRRTDKTVMGSRFGLQPMLGQRPDGTWSFHSGSIVENRNAVDALLRACLGLYSRRSTA